VTPMIPFFFLGIVGIIIILGDWRRIGLRLQMSSTGSAPALSTGPLGGAWVGFKSTRQALDRPLTAWRNAGVIATLPIWVGIAYVGMVFTDRLPKSLEPYSLFDSTLLLAFTLVLALIVVRLVDLIGLARAIERLLSELAVTPMVRAFDRVPANLAHENLFRTGASNSSARRDSDPRIDRQFQAVLSGYQSLRTLIVSDRILGVVNLSRMDALIPGSARKCVLPAMKWWKTINVMTAFLAPYWTLRPSPAATSESDKKGSGDEDADWPGADVKLRPWLRSVEDLIAMIMVRQFAWVRAAVHSLITFLVVGLVILFLVLTSYPFEPQEPMFALLGAITVITASVIVIIAIQSSRDEVISRLNKTATDRFTFDRQFMTMMITSVVPLLGLLGAFSYSLSDLFRSLFEPFFRGG